MRKSSISVSVLILLFVCAITFLGSSALAGIPDNAKALAAVDDEWAKAAVSGDVDKVVSYYAEDGVAYPPNAPMVQGHAALKQAWGQMLADPKAKLSWKTTTAGVDGKTGYTSGTYQVTGADGATLEKGKYLCVWAKSKDGSWKAIHDMWNADSK